ncbi:MAG: hypothetical protein ACHQUC_03645, partial [Chlamydiales bacterium]
MQVSTIYREHQIVTATPQFDQNDHASYSIKRCLQIISDMIILIWKAITSVYRLTFDDQQGNSKGGKSENGKLSRGRITLPNGDWFKGELNERGFTGQGRETFDQGATREGHFKNGRWVQGKIRWPNGDWLNGELTTKGFFGKGRWTLADGTIAEGDFEKTQLIRGTITRANEEPLEIGKPPPEDENSKKETLTLDDGTIVEGDFASNGRLIRGKERPPEGVYIIPAPFKQEATQQKEFIFVGNGVKTKNDFQIHSFEGQPEEGCGFSDRWIIYRSGRRLEGIERVSKRAIEQVGNETVDYLQGTKTIEQLDIRENNTLLTLKVVKFVDILIKKNVLTPAPHSTYLIRQAILKLSPHCSTSVIFTNSLNPLDWTDLNYLTNPSNWVNERFGIQAKLIIDYKILSQSLSNRIKGIFATRGNTGVGKSFFIKRYLDEQDHLIHGVLNPDYIKAILKKLD